MNDLTEDYSRTQAYNFLKKLLGVSQKVLIKKEFFGLFFIEDDGGRYLLKKPEDVVKNIFTEKGIKHLNDLFFKKKQENNTEEATKVFIKTLSVVRDSMAA